jgi:hypothetical protein
MPTLSNNSRQSLTAGWLASWVGVAGASITRPRPAEDNSKLAVPVGVSAAGTGRVMFDCLASQHYVLSAETLDACIVWSLSQVAWC